MSENAPKKEYKKPSVLAVLKESDGSALSFNYANAVNFLSYGFLHLSLLKNHELANKEPTDITIDDIKHTRFSFPEELVFEAMGYGSSEKTYARKAILKITHALKKMDIGINSKSLVGEFDVNNHNGFTTFVATAAFEDGFLHIETAQTLLYSLLTQERIFTGLVDFHHFKKQYAPNLYQLAMDMIENESKTETEWLAVSTLCDKLGVKTASYRNDGRRLKEKVLAPALEVFKENNVFEYELSIETANQDKKKKRGGQSITHFKIIAKRKEISSSDQILNFGSTRRSTLEAAIEALGVEGRGNIPKIIDEECLGTDGKPNIEFLEWAIQRGFQVQEWKRFSSDKNAQKGQRDAAKKGEKTYGFFGHWRKNILGASRQDWLRKDKLLGVLVDNLNNALSDYQRVVAKQELKKVIEKALLLDFLTSLEENEVVFATFRDKFGRWLHKELPATHAKYANGEYGASLKELSGKGYSSLLLYADDNYSLFGIDGFIEYQSKILLDPNDQRWELELQAILRPA